jgi:DAK2 domain fusion protein YloV
LDAVALRDWAHAAVDELIAHSDEINRLNVFPVADSDTGTNMLFTMRSALAEAETEVGSGDIARVAAALSAGAIHGARGNSGVILAQILRGIADVIASVAADAGGELLAVSAAVLGTALRHAVGLVVASMGGDEVAGTIVSVLQAAAGTVEQCADDGEGLAAAVTAAGDAAAVALDKTPEQLDVLAEAGAVDSGGRGLLVLLDALIATITGRAPARTPYQPAPRPPQSEAAPAPLSSHLEPQFQAPEPQFEVMYVLQGCDAAAADTLRGRLAELGESVVVAASGSGAGGYSVHVHTDDAGAAIEAGLELGRPHRIQISALSGAGSGLAPGSWTRERAVLAVVDGDDAADLFGAEGAFVLRPDPDAPDSTTAVSARQLLRAVVETGAAQVMVLPNGYVAAEELVAGSTTAIGWGIDVVPVPTGSMVQGLAALAVHDLGRPVVDDGYNMARAAGGARYGTVRIASDEALTLAGTCQPGDGLGISGDEVLIVAENVDKAAIGLIDLLLAAGGDLVTVLIGADVGAAVGDVLERHVHDHHPGVEMVAYRTGHRGDPLLIGVE